MRDPRQETRRLPHSFKDAPDGKIVCAIHHEDGRVIDCPSGKDYAEAAHNADTYVEENFPGRTL